MKKVKTSLSDDNFADEGHRDEVNERIQQEIGVRIEDAPFYWSVDARGLASILSRQSFADSIAQCILEGLEYEHLILEYQPVNSFREAKAKAIDRLGFAISELKMNVEMVKRLRLKSV